MKSSSLDKVSTLRSDRNGDLVKRLKNGESLTSFSSESSWFPPRPIIKKDSGAISTLYGKKPDKRLNAQLQAPSTPKVFRGSLRPV